MKNIRFEREGIQLVGRLFLPAPFNPQRTYDAIIIQGSLTSVKEMMGSLYGAKLAEKGFVCLTFDYSHFGESGGEPRQLEDPEEKRKDLQAAVNYLRAQPFVKNVSMLGICTSGGNAIELAAQDARLRACMTVAGFFPEPEVVKGMLGDAKYQERIEASRRAFETYRKTGENRTITAYSETDSTAANYAPVADVYDYYTNPQRGNVLNYRNELSVLSFEKFYTSFQPVKAAAHVTIPVLLVHSDGCALPEQAKKVFAALQGEKKLAWEGGGSHFDYYDQPEQVDYAVRQIAEFLSAQKTPA